MQMEKHISVVAILHLVYSSLALLAGIIVFVVFAGIGTIVTHAPDTPAEETFSAAAIIWGIGTIIAILLVIFSIPGIVGAVGLLRRKEWGRILVIIVSFFDLLHIPLGTILGGYSIWVLFNNETIALLRMGAQQAPQAPPAAH